ncbi:outer membrane beta-barrel protein [Myxococcus sp. CA051A]|uniref:outer membrane beta-barrel protein n=1 Tax=unclassified Myxococcus TaxID=2648731 RepID=UPI00157B2D32|nr:MULTISPECIES: outer membrane beta-barrel protein [unclassified Myxococcus]NTX12401.1 outer membrane beta-barrel protein [Myxococcus sp. CA056]NTX33420.1 outer membrane beta-barrel protein [Myxococcus sp. CA033]NTX57076.1 outer membrane beta-barrel protein [Myxococcus sp. CA039A]NTX59472.1 outer membrane beta-barrel protein [Myxococcus sp. CA051A]
MTGRLSWALAAAVALGSAGASAQEVATYSAPTGLEVTVGLGFQAGAGYVYKNGARLDRTVGDVKLSDAANGAVPFLVEVGYRVTPNWFVGAYGSYSYILTKENPYSCFEGWECAASQLRFGPQVQYHFSPTASFDPFVGVGFGMVLLNNENSGPTQVQVGPGAPVTANLKLKSQTRGPEFVNVTVGGKWRLGHSLSFGPYLTGTYARYTTRSGDTTLALPAPLPTTTTPLGPAEDGPYGLIMLGIRGSWNI